LRVEKVEPLMDVVALEQAIRGEQAAADAVGAGVGEQYCVTAGEEECAYPVMPSRLSPRPWRSRTASPFTWWGWIIQARRVTLSGVVIEASVRSASWV
jgi:hypothetical protein